ncbi:MAG: hypothetical protein D6791_03785 [Chloroflexi bacterium]|nr:MAG: hypothetical protein D6791_03785 [Chloroflexota bacterium]
MTFTEPMAATLAKPRHSWLKRVNVAFVPGPMNAVVEQTIEGILAAFRSLGHTVQDRPDDHTSMIFTSARYGEAINWRKSLLLAGRVLLKLKRMPPVFTLVHMTRSEFHGILGYLERALAKEPPDPEDFEFPGLAPSAFHVLVEQGRRGGPILSLERILQAQTKSIRILLIVGDEKPEDVYHFDLVGAYPKSSASDPDFYEDIALRTITTVSTHEVTDHQVVGELIPYDFWRSLSTPQAMRTAAQELGRRNFFTEMVQINRLVRVPAVENAVASQYSEGCFATWEPALDAIIATITGSARPVDKDNITEDELAILSGVRPGGIGAYVRHVEKKRNDPPSSEAVEMLEMDQALPRVRLGAEWGIEKEVPVVRSKLHGHRGVYAYDPRFVEYTPLDPPYFHYLVSCATEAQARAVKGAFSRSQALQNPEDPRQLVFTILPGHGLVMAEKWVAGKAPFQLMWEYMDAGYIEIDSHVPQGPIEYVPDEDGRHVLHEVDPPLPRGDRNPVT